MSLVKTLYQTDWFTSLPSVPVCVVSLEAVLAGQSQPGCLMWLQQLWGPSTLAPGLSGWKMRRLPAMHFHSSRTMQSEKLEPQVGPYRKEMIGLEYLSTSKRLKWHKFLCMGSKQSTLLTWNPSTHFMYCCPSMLSELNCCTSVTASASNVARVVRISDSTHVSHSFTLGCSVNDTGFLKTTWRETKVCTKVTLN